MNIRALFAQARLTTTLLGPRTTVWKGMYILSNAVLDLPLINQVACVFAKWSVSTSTKRIRTIEEAVNFAYRGRPFGINLAPIQVQSELMGLLELVHAARPRTVLEIGTANGGSLFLWFYACAQDAEFVSVDLPRGPFGSGYPRWRSGLYKSLARPSQRVTLIMANSHDENTARKVMKSVSARPLDFLFIDGDHSYEGVRKDFETYAKMVKPGGLVALHDICKHDPASGCQVSVFWDEIKQRFRSTEIIADRNQGWAGVGVVFV